MDAILAGVGAVFTVAGLLAILVGCIAGIIIGALPGLGPSLGIALLIPATYSWSPSVSFNLLVSLYLAAEYGGSISAILIGTPGTAAAAATVIDGYQMNRQGAGALALRTSLAASTVGGVIGGLILMAASWPLVAFALRFGPPEYFAFGLFGLTLVATLSGKALLKGLAMAVVGLLITVIGIDPISGRPRFTFGYYELYEGIPFLVILIGVFAVAEAIALAEAAATPLPSIAPDARSERIGRARSMALIPNFLRSSLIGAAIGALPGAGANIAAWLAYDQARRFSKRPELFGNGSIEGVAAPEAANSASVGGALIPLLTLGLPGSPTTAVLVGALMIHGLTPGPKLFTDEPELVYGLFVGMILAYPVIYLLGIAAMPVWRRVLALPNAILAPAILLLSCVCAFSVRSLMLDVWCMLGFGVAGYLLKKLAFPMAPLILALVLGPMIETNFAQSMIMSRGSADIFFTRWLSGTLLAIAVLVVVWSVIESLRTPGQKPGHAADSRKEPQDAR